MQIPVPAVAVQSNEADIGTVKNKMTYNGMCNTALNKEKESVLAPKFPCVDAAHILATCL